MKSRALTWTQPSLSFALTINIHADRSLLVLAGLAWLVCLAIARLGRVVRRWGDWWSAAGTVIRRRFRRWLAGWRLSAWLPAMPAMGVG